MLNWLKRSLGALLAVCMLVSMLPTALATDRSELDGHWAKESLTYFADEGWLKGYEDGTYKPDRTITRAEFITLLNRVCGLTEQTEGVLDKFTDMKKDQWYYKDVAIAVTAGYVEGDSKTTISPNANITREQAFTMIGRLANLSSEKLNILNQFTDGNSVSAYAKPFVAALASAGLVNGYEDQTIRPQRNITRAEAIKTMYVCLDLLQPADPDPDPDPEPDPDPDPKPDPDPDPDPKPDPDPEPETDTYVLMNIPYAEFYAAELKNDVAVDGVTSATKNKTRTGSLVGGSYHVNADGTDITGITFPVKVDKSVDLSKYTKITDDSKVEITVTNRGQTSTTPYSGKDALFESDSYSYYVLSEAPACYKEVSLDKDGNLTFGKLQGAESQKLDVTASLTTKTSYGDYQVDVELDNDTVSKLGTVYGVILSTKEGADYGMRHLENVWRNTEIAWCTGFTTSVHNCPTSSDHYKAMMGQTINKITYITSSGIYTIDTELYVPVKFDGKLTVENAKVVDGKATVTAALPEDYQAVYTVTDAAGAAVSGMTVKDGKLTWAATSAVAGAYTLTVTDQAGKYASVSASFVLSTDTMPAQAAADNQSIVKAEDATDADFAAFLANISKVNVNGKDYAPSGRGGVKVIKADGTIDFTTAPFKTDAVDGKYVLTITATGYENTLTVTVPETYYLYASLTYEEYWANEGVYNATNTESSDVKDDHDEYDKGGFDAVTRATTNHGLHRGSFQQDVVIHTADKDYYPLYWIDGNNFVDREDGQTYNKNDIGIVNYNITGIKYVPVAVRAQDYAQFIKDYEVTLNGDKMYGGYSENQLSSYAELVAEVTADTNGLKTATLTDGVWSFGARKTGTGSGIAGQTLATAEGTENNLRKNTAENKEPTVGNFGEFLRFDVNGSYGGLGSAMQTVKWTYYGTDSTYTTPVAAYGTKFAADNWMHKSMGIQLGLTDSIRCQLPADTDGTGYWTVTIYGLGYADYTAQFEVTADNLPKKEAAKMTAQQMARLNALWAEGNYILNGFDDATIASTPALSDLQAHCVEAIALINNPDATEAQANELLSELPGLIAAAQAVTPAAETYTGTATVNPDEDDDFEPYALTATFTLEGSKIKSVTTTITSTAKKDVKYSNQATEALNAALSGKTLEEAKSTDVTKLDAVSGATCSSKAIIEAAKTAAKAS